jgi:hypothetical protein
VVLRNREISVRLSSPASGLCSAHDPLRRHGRALSAWRDSGSHRGTLRLRAGRGRAGRRHIVTARPRPPAWAPDPRRRPAPRPPAANDRPAGSRRPPASSERLSAMTADRPVCRPWLEPEGSDLEGNLFEVGVDAPQRRGGCPFDRWIVSAAGWWVYCELLESKPVGQPHFGAILRRLRPCLRRDLFRDLRAERRFDSCELRSKNAPKSTRPMPTATRSASAESVRRVAGGLVVSVFFVETVVPGALSAAAVVVWPETVEVSKDGETRPHSTHSRRRTDRTSPALSTSQP